VDFPSQKNWRGLAIEMEKVDSAPPLPSPSSGVAAKHGKQLMDACLASRWEEALRLIHKQDTEPGDASTPEWSGYCTRHLTGG